MKRVIIIIILVTLVAFAGPAFSPSIVSFTTGQVSPRLEGRADFQNYNSSCRTIENMYVRVQGPVSRRPGTRFISDVNDSDSIVRLVPFEYSTDDSYVLAFDNGTLGFYRTTE